MKNNFECCRIHMYFYRHEVPVTSQPITIVHMDDDIVVVNKPASIPVSGLNDRHKFLFLLFSVTILFFYLFYNHQNLCLIFLF